MRIAWYKHILLWAFVLCFSSMAQARIYLVSVGISDYPGKENDLRLPHNDAATMQWVYDENSKAETILLMNAEGTASAIKSAMQKLYSKATANDIVVFFFSGHGVSGGFCSYDGYLTFKDVRATMAKCKSRHKMIFADACFSGSIRQSGNRTSEDYGAKNSDVMLFLSCRSGEYSIERAGMTNGFFTYALQHGLRGGADKNRDKTITARELFNYVSAYVQKNSNGKQHPVMWGKFSDNMPVMIW